MPSPYWVKFYYGFVIPVNERATRVLAIHNMPIDIEPVYLKDAHGVASVSMRAFYTDPHWRLYWHNTPINQIIDVAEKRTPQNLLSGRHNKRHQKAVDRETGEMVGYARWLLPDPGSDTEWIEARTIDLTPEERKDAEERFQAGTSPETGMQYGIDPARVRAHSRQLGHMMEKVVGDVPHLGMFLADGDADQ